MTGKGDAGNDPHTSRSRGGRLTTNPNVHHNASSSSSSFPALGFTIFGEIFAYLTGFLIQPSTQSHSVFMDGACWVFFFFFLFCFVLFLFVCFFFGRAAGCAFCSPVEGMDVRICRVHVVECMPV